MIRSLFCVFMFWFVDACLLFLFLVPVIRFRIILSSFIQSKDTKIYGTIIFFFYFT
jgi:hypothetical protein